MFDIGGIGHPEGRDLASASALRRFAEDADARILALRDGISSSRYSDCAILRPSVNGFALSNGTLTIDFDTVVYNSGAAIKGVGLPVNFSRSGVYLFGGFASYQTSGAVSRIITRMELFERRGSRLVNGYTESVDSLNARTPRGIEQASIVSLVELHNGPEATVTLKYVVTASGTVTPTTACRLWMIRMRDI